MKCNISLCIMYISCLFWLEYLGSILLGKYEFGFFN